MAKAAKVEKAVRGRPIGGAKHRNGSVNMSHYLRVVMLALVSDGWDLATVSTEEIISKARGKIRDKDLREKFQPTAAQVSIVKRSLNGGSPTGKPGRPSLEALGYEEEVVAEAA